MGSSTENSAYGPTRNPWDPTSACRAAPPAGRRRLWRADWPLGARLRHRRLDQAAGGALRPGRPAAHVRDRLALRDRRLRVQPRPGRPDHEDRPRLRAPLPDHRRPRPVRLDHRRLAGAGRDPGGRGPQGPARRRAEGAERGRGHRAGRQRAVRARSSSAASSAPRWGRRRCRARSSSACPATT